MTGPVLLDAGPLAAFLSRRDQHRAWSEEQFARLAPPFLTCEAVISEACFLLQSAPGGVSGVMEVLTRGAVRLSFHLDAEIEAIAALMARYENVPMSVADACLVRMSELTRGSRVLTLDSDFRIYRKNGRQVIPVIMPEDR